MAPPRDALSFPSSQAAQIDPFLTPAPSSPDPFVTLTFATSLDSSLSLAPGLQTALSGAESKSMTHYLRSKHDAILIGAGTAVADDPSLNCRIDGAGGYGGEGLSGQPRPVIIDPRGRWEFSAESKVIKLAAEGKGRAPWVVTTSAIGEGKGQLLETVGGRLFVLPTPTGGCADSPLKIAWPSILRLLADEGVMSVMIEGGGTVINDLLDPQHFSLVGSVIVTIAPTWLGKGGVQVCPDERVEDGRRVPVGRLRDVRWIPLGDDVVLCGRPKLG